MAGESSNTEQLAIEVLARINDLETNMKKATALTSKAFTDMRKSSKTATATMEADAKRSSAVIVQAAAMTGTKIGDLGKATANLAYQQKNLAMQLGDVGQSLALGASPLQVLLQQGPQIAQIYGPGEGGIGRAFKETGNLLVGLVTRFGPLLAVLAAAYGAYKLLMSSSVAAKNAVDEQTKALAAQAAPASSLEGMVKDLASAQSAYADAVANTATTQVGASQQIIAATKAEFEAKKQLFELELARQKASIEVQRAAIAQIGADMRGRIDQGVFTRDDRIQTGTADPLVGDLTINASRLEAVQKTLEMINADPATAELKKLRAELTLNEIGVGKMEDALKKAWNGQPIEIDKTTKSTKASADSVRDATDAWEGLRQVSESVVAQQKATADKMKEVADRVRVVADTTASAMGDIRRGFLEGGSAAEVFGDAALNVFDKIASAIETQFANTLVGAFMGPSTGGFNLLSMFGAGTAVAGGAAGAGGMGVVASSASAMARPASIRPAGARVAASRPARGGEVDLKIRLVSEGLNIRPEVEAAADGRIARHTPGIVKAAVGDYRTHVLPGDVKKVMSRPRDKKGPR